MNSKIRKKRKVIFQNIFIIFFVSVIVLSAISYLVSRFYFNDVIKEKFIRNFNSANDNAYKLTIKNLNVNLLRSYILIKEAEIKSSSNLNKKVYIKSVTIPFIEIKQIDLIDLIKNNHLNVNAFLMQFPKFHLTYTPNIAFADTSDSVEHYLTQRKNYIKDINAQSFLIESSTIELKNISNDSVMFFQENFSLKLDSLHIHANIGAYMNKVKTVNDFMRAMLSFTKPPE